MSERIYWRDEGGYVWGDRHVDGPAPEHWQRVHVLTDAELAAEKAKWQAEALRAYASAAHEGDPGVCLTWQMVAVDANDWASTFYDEKGSDDGR